MKRSLTCGVCVCLFLSSHVIAQDGLKKLWPFGADNSFKSPSNSFSSGLERKQPAPKKPLRLPSPTKMLDRMEKSTDAMFAKTRATMKGMQDFLNPFRSKPKAPGQKREPFWTALLPKQQPSSGPATLDEFLSLERPDF